MLFVYMIFSVILLLCVRYASTAVMTIMTNISLDAISVFNEQNVEVVLIFGRIVHS